MMGAALDLFAPDGIPEVTAGTDLAALILDALGPGGLRAGDVVVLAQKIVSKAEGRQVALSAVRPGARSLRLAERLGKDARVVELILGESVAVVRERPGLVIVRDRRGLIMANAGIDASNVTAEEPSVLLLPIDPDGSAAALRAAIRTAAGVDVGVIVADSFGRAWRMGTTGTAIGAAGVVALADLRGNPDRAGRPLETSEEALADEIAAAATLLMGQGAEGRPLVRLRGFAPALPHGCAADLQRPPEMDLFL